MNTNTQNTISYEDLRARCLGFGMPSAHIEELELFCNDSIQALCLRFREWAHLFCEDESAIPSLLEAGYPIPGCVLH